VGTRAREDFHFPLYALARDAADRLDDVVGENYPVSWFAVPASRSLAPAEQTFHQMHDLHHLLFKVLVGVALLPRRGALKHHFIDRNGVLKRILPFGGVK
jgi:cytochrome b561